MKLAKMYAKEFNSGGEKSCAKCGRQCHGTHCSFCIDRTLIELGVSVETMRKASAVFRRTTNPEKINEAIAAIEAEIKK